MVKLRKIITLALLTVLVAVALSGCCLRHQWLEATCNTPKTCEKCGTVEGEASGHIWKAATCEAPKTCSVCGEAEGVALEHEWNAAACETPKTCLVCGTTEGEPLGHAWADATCTEPKTCSVCATMEGEVRGHRINISKWPFSLTCAEDEHTMTFSAEGICRDCGEEVSCIYANDEDAARSLFPGERKLLAIYVHDQGYHTRDSLIAMYDADTIEKSILSVYEDGTFEYWFVDIGGKGTWRYERYEIEDSDISFWYSATYIDEAGDERAALFHIALNVAVALISMYHGDFTLMYM